MTTSAVRFDMFAWQVMYWPVMREDVRYLETLNLGTIWLSDIFVLPPDISVPVLEGWTTLAAVASCTDRVRLGTLVSNVALRHPALLAKQAATVDCISGGRLDLGIGSGDNYSEERAALGLPSLTPAARVDRLHEAVDVVDRLLRDEQVTYHGEYYHLDEARIVPPPVQKPRPPLIIAGHTKRALQVVASHADVWMSELPGKSSEDVLHGVRERNRLLDEYCSASGRDPATVERAGIAGWSDAGTPFASRDAFQDFVGRFQEAGIQRIVFSFGSAATPAPFDAWVAVGRWATRETLDAFAAHEMCAMQGGG